MNPETKVLKTQNADLQATIRVYAQRDLNQVMEIARANRMLTELQAEHAACGKKDNAAAVNSAPQGAEGTAGGL